MNGPVSRLSCSAASASRSAWIGHEEAPAELGLRAQEAGIEELQIDHRSPTWFSTGVPVRAMRQPAFSERAAWACLVSGFLMFWASSSTTPAQSTCSNSSQVAVQQGVAGQHQGVLASPSWRRSSP